MSDQLNSEDEMEAHPSPTSLVVEEESNKSLPNAKLNNLVCKACQKRFTDPRLLPCLHSFCAECIRSFEPFIVSSDDRNPSLSVSMSSLSSIVNTVVTVICPTCETEVNLPKRGVYELPVDFMLRRELLEEALDPECNGIPCDLCADETDATSRCFECSVNICHFCAEAHKRQRKTTSHHVVCLEDVHKGGADGLWSPLKCQAHLREEQRLFCETCEKTVCRDCCIVEHRDHIIDFNDDIIGENRALITQLISKTEPHILSLQSMLNKIEDLHKEIDVNKDTVSEEINQFIAGYISALHKHHEGLLKKVDKVCEGKKRALKAQELHVKQILQDVQHSCTFASKAVAEGNSDELLSVKPLLARRMMDMSQLQVQAAPRADAFLKFIPDVCAGEVDSFEVFGDIESKLVSPLKCSASGDGLYVAREQDETEFCVVIRDKEGKLCSQGAQDIYVEIVPRGRRNGEHTVVDIDDAEDGTHRIYYTPEEAGQYFISIFVSSQHIQGSPFMVNVRCAWQEHNGIFHCCTFCSSEGRKDVTCACGATMPGGFQGCGHGHEGHPGKSHWSCCGKFNENSECSRVFNQPSKMKTVSV